MPSVAVRDHRGNSLPYIEALSAKGWDIQPLGAAADVLMLDFDVPHGGYRDMIQVYRDAGARIVLYPHGANPVTAWDGLYTPQPADLCLVPGEGHRMVMEAYGYPNPILVTGFSFCGIKRFKPSPGERVLFAPIHPKGDGYLDEVSKAENAKAFRALVHSRREIHVRHMGSLEQNGLWPVDGVTYYPAGLGDPTDLGQIDSADVVVASGTFLSLAVARGRPAVAFGQIAPVEDPSDPGEQLRSWDRYEPIMRYPHDLGEILALGCACVSEAQGWRERFIGKPLDANLLNDRLRGLVTEAVTA